MSETFELLLYFIFLTLPVYWLLRLEEHSIVKRMQYILAFIFINITSAFVISSLFLYKHEKRLLDVFSIESIFHFATTHLWVWVAALPVSVLYGSWLVRVFKIRKLRRY